jgi:FlaA1/EpsC-like NDP-sugar epimerase
MNLQFEKLLGRKQNLFFEDFKRNKIKIEREIKKSSFLIIGAAGSIGQAVSFEIFKRKPKKIHLVDISENNMVELVRNIRSSLGYIQGEFKTFEIDVGGIEFEKFYKKRSYDYIFNFSALKHVRSEKDPYTLIRMLKVNILNPLKILNLSKKKKN